LRNYIKGFVKLGNARDFPIDASVESVFHLADLRKVMPLDSMDLAGDLQMHILTNGKYQPSRKIFPVTVADVQLDNGRLQTKYYPHPLEKIQVSARISNSTGTMKSMEVVVTPLSFRFEGQPFTLKADLRNFQDLKYNIASRGLLDLGKIYQVFAIKGYDVKGFVEADLSLKGRQSDAQAGHYDRCPQFEQKRHRLQYGAYVCRGRIFCDHAEALGRRFDSLCV